MIMKTYQAEIILSNGKVIKVNLPDFTDKLVYKTPEKIPEKYNTEILENTFFIKNEEMK